MATFMDNKIFSLIDKGNLEEIKKYVEENPKCLEKRAYHKNIGGHTALLYAVAAEKMLVAKLLVELNADIHAVNERGYHALHIAAKNDDADLIYFFLGTEIDKKALTGWEQKLENLATDEKLCLLFNPNYLEEKITKDPLNVFVKEGKCMVSFTTVAVKEKKKFKLYFDFAAKVITQEITKKDHQDHHHAYGLNNPAFREQTAEAADFLIKNNGSTCGYKAPQSLRC